MNSLNIAGTTTTPSISCDADTGLILMQGDSYPENSFEFFNALIDWVKHFLTQSTIPLTIDLRLVYLNTSSVKAMMDIFDMLEAAHQNGRNVSVKWHYDIQNERVMELAEEFKEDCSFPFLITTDD